jgi:hypothetical protein
MFNALFAALKHDRDRALLAFWVSNGARAEELLTSRQRDALPGQQVLGVVRKGSRAYQQLPCSADTFVWLRLVLARAAEPSPGAMAGIQVSRQSLLADVANLTARNSRLSAHIARFERRLSQALGQAA